MTRQARRAVVVSVSACPKCGASVGQACFAKNGQPRVGLHRERRWLEPSKKAVRVQRGKPAEKEGSFYATDEWRRLRYRALIRYGNACQCCGTGPRLGRALHVDHIKPRSKYPQLELELRNLQILCEGCNLGKGAWDETDWRSDEVPS